MTVEELEAAFEKYDAEYKFDLVENKLSGRPDIHAFLLLDSLVPGTRDMVAGGEHDIIYLDVEPCQLATVVSEEQVCELRRCGVFIDSNTDSLAMFV